MKTQKKGFLQAITGIISGFVNGFFGGGGGMIVVPMLTYLLKFEQKQAHATSIAVILPITVVSSIIYLIGGKNDFGIIGACTLGVFLGGILGAKLLKKASNQIIGYIFCAVMAIAGIRMLFG